MATSFQFVDNSTAQIFTSHFGDDVKQEETKRVCPQGGCGRTYSTDGALRNHLRRKHTMERKMLPFHPRIHRKNRSLPQPCLPPMDNPFRHGGSQSSCKVPLPPLSNTTRPYSRTHSTHTVDSQLSQSTPKQTLRSLSVPADVSYAQTTQASSPASPPLAFTAAAEPTPTSQAPVRRGLRKSRRFSEADIVREPFTRELKRQVAANSGKILPSRRLSESVSGTYTGTHTYTPIHGDTQLDALDLWMPYADTCTSVLAGSMRDLQLSPSSPSSPGTPEDDVTTLEDFDLQDLDLQQFAGYPREPSWPYAYNQHVQGTDQELALLDSYYLQNGEEYQQHIPAGQDYQDTFTSAAPMSAHDGRFLPASAVTTAALASSQQQFSPGRYVAAPYNGHVTHGDWAYSQLQVGDVNLDNVVDDLVLCSN